MRVSGAQRMTLAPSFLSAHMLLRATRLWEALYVLGEIQRGVGADWEYFEMNVAAIEGLRGFELE